MNITELKQKLEIQIANSFDVTSKSMSINEDTFRPVIQGNIAFEINIEDLQDAKVALTELEMYTLIGKTISDKIAKFGK